MPSRNPVLWSTLLFFVLVALSTKDVIMGGIHLFVILPLVILGQWGIRWVFLRFRSPVWLRRSVMLIPALVIGFMLFRLGGRDTQALRVVFAGNIPAGIHDLHLTEDAWTDYVVHAYFRCDPASLRAILESPPFTRCDHQPGVLTFRASEFSGLTALPDAHGSIITYERTNMGKDGNFCTVQTDAAFSFACVVYAVD